MDKKTIIIKKAEMPSFLPHGWKKEVAGVLGICQNSVTNHLKKGKGITYDRIVKAVTEKYGKP